MLRMLGTKEPYNASDIVERQVESGRGEKLAIIAEDARLTYSALRIQVNRAAGLLQELGVKREHRVILALDDTSVFPILFLAVIRLGAVPVPVSPFEKDENVRHFIADSCAAVVVTDTLFHERLAQAAGAQSVCYVVRGGERASRDRAR